MTSNNVEEFLEKFKEIELKRLQLEAEKKVLESEKEKILFDLGKKNVDDVQQELYNISVELDSLLTRLEMPQEILNELKNIDGKS